MASSTIKRPVADTGWTSAASYLKYRRIGDVLYIWGNALGSPTIPASGNAKIGTLPEGYRPSEAVQFPVGNRGAAFPTLYGVVATNGDITVYNPGSIGVAYFIYNAAIPL